MKPQAAAVEAAIEEHRIEVAHRRADFEAVEDADQSGGRDDEAGFLGDLADDIFGGAFADVAEASRIPPAPGRALNHKEFVAVIEDDRTTPDADSDIAVIARADLGAPSLKQFCTVMIALVDEGAHAGGLAEEVFVALGVIAGVFEGEASACESGDAFDEAGEFEQQIVRRVGHNGGV